MSESSPTYGSGVLPQIDLRITMPPVRPTRGARPSPELTIREYELRKLQTAIEAITGAESRIRLGLNGDRPRLCHLGLDTIRTALTQIAEVVRVARPADLRPELSEPYLAQVIDDLTFCEVTAAERNEGAARRNLALARVHVKHTVQALRGEVTP